MIDQATVDALDAALLKNLHILDTLHKEFGYGQGMPPTEHIMKFSTNLTGAEAYEMVVSFYDQASRNIHLLQTLRENNIKQETLRIAHNIITLKV